MKENLVSVQVFPAGILFWYLKKHLFIDLFIHISNCDTESFLFTHFKWMFA